MKHALVLGDCEPSALGALVHLIELMPQSLPLSLAQGLPLTQGLLPLITRGCPFLQGFVTVFQGFFMSLKKRKTSLT